jgi:hypothetical protein
MEMQDFFTVFSTDSYLNLEFAMDMIKQRYVFLSYIRYNHSLKSNVVLKLLNGISV